MLAIAEKIVEQQSGDFDPGRVRRPLRGCPARDDRGEEKGQAREAAQPANDDGKVVDLMAALKKSLEGGGSGGTRQRAERFAPAKTKPPQEAGGRTRAA